MRFVMAILVLLTLGAAVDPAAAQDGRRARMGVETGEMQSLDRILSGIRQQYPGRLSDVGGPDDGRYHIKWLTPDGRVLMFDTDARTGRVLGVQGNVNPAPRYRGEAMPREGYQGQRYGDPRYQRPPEDYSEARPDGPLRGRYFQDRRGYSEGRGEGRGEGRDNNGRHNRDR